MAAFAEGTPCWLDVSLPDLQAGKRFYGDLFGWTFPADRQSAAYADAYSEGSRVAALVAKRDGRMPTAWGVYFATPDAVDAARRVVAAGGRMVRDPVRVGRLGVVALAADPGGAVFGLWQSGTDAGEDTAAQAAGDAEAEPGGHLGPGEGAPGAGGTGTDAGFERQGSPGSFRWTEVYTRAPEPVDAFYEQVLRVGYSEITGLRGEDVPFRMWSPRGATPCVDTAVAGRSVMTEASPAVLPGHFLNYFAVADCDATAAAVVRLGGRVRQPPFDIPYGRMAVFRDDQGAVFAVLAERAPSAGAADSPAASEARGPEKTEAPGGPRGPGETVRPGEAEAGQEGAAGQKRRWGRRRS